MGSTKAADACPWPKPFPEGFDRCPAFLQAHFIPLDSALKPLQPVLTCRHLAIKPVPQQRHRWYAACGIGDERERERWAMQLGDWLRRAAQIRRKMERINRPFIVRIWAAKARQLAAAQQRESTAEASQELRELAAGFVAESASFLEENREELRDLNLPAEAVLLLLRRSLDQFVEQKTTTPGWTIPDDVLDRFPSQVRLFFRPRPQT